MIFQNTSQAWRLTLRKDKFMDLNKITKKFILGESFSPPSLFSYIQALQETMSNMVPRTVSETRRLEVAKSQIREIRKFSKKLQERVDILEEQVKVLEENRSE